MNLPDSLKPPSVEPVFFELSLSNEEVEQLMGRLTPAAPPPQDVAQVAFAAGLAFLGLAY
jgi:hypothetical protein